jgi:hypothetical protein
MAINLGEIEKKNKKKKNNNYKNVSGLQISTEYVDVPVIPQTVKQTNYQKQKPEEKKWYEQILQKPEAFEDGYQFGDVTKTALGTAGDVLTTGAKATWDFVKDKGMDVAGGIYWGLDKTGILPGAYDAFTDIEKYGQDVRVISDIDRGVNKFNEISRDNSILGDTGKAALEGTIESLENMYFFKDAWAASSFATSYRHQYTDALKNGATKEQATASGVISALSDVGSEYLFSGFIKLPGTGSGIDTALGKATEKIGNKFLRTIAQYGINIGGEAFEEVLAGFGDAWGKKLTYLKDDIESGKIKFKDIYSLEDALENAGMGALSAMFGSANPRTIQNIRDGRNLVTGLTSSQQKYIDEIAQQRMVEAEKRNTKLNLIQKGKINQRTMTDFEKGRLIDARNLPLRTQQAVNLPGLNAQTGAKVQSSVKGMDLQQSAYYYGINPNSEAITTAKAMLDNKGIKSRFDADAFKDSGENSKWVKKGGVREVIFNPNASADVLLEEIAIHELTHDLMSSENSNEALQHKDIISYVSKLKGYEEKRTKLEELYSSIKDENGKLIYNPNSAKFKELIDEEVLANTLGKNIGSQEYVRRLIDDEPSIAKNIYDWVVNKVANKNGVKNEKAYWNNVKNNFEKAYNMEYEGKGNKGNTKYSFMSEKGLANAIKSDSNNQILADKLAQAKKLRKQGYSNEQIRQKTLWFQDPNGKWLFEIADLNSDFIVPLKEGMTKKVEEIFKHNDLFEAYPQLKKNTVKVKPMKQGKNGDIYGGEVNPFTGTITLNSEILKQKNGEKKLRKVLLHELQHQIQNIEGLEKGDGGKNAIRYYSSLGEIQSSEVEDRSKMTPKEIKQNAPEVSKQYPIHPYIKDIHNKPNSKFAKEMLSNPQVAELYNEIYNNGNEGEYERAKINRMGTTKNISAERKISLLRGRGQNDSSTKSIYQGKRETTQETKTKELDNSSFLNEETRYSLSDNKGRELSEGQQEYFKDSKVRDADGNLLVVYHGSENEFNIFDIDRAGARGSHYTSGFYFTTSEESAKDYATYKGKVYKTYLNITNPYIPSADIINKDGSVTFAPSFYEEFEQKFKDKLPIDWKELNSARKGTAARYILQDMGYDGVINGNVYVAFEPNQIKNVDNLNPTDDADIRYSLSDNQGRELSEGQQEYFKNSKVRDEQGRLLELYHGTPNNNFNVFEQQKVNTGAGLMGLKQKGFYFTDRYESAESYSAVQGINDKNGVKKVYLNMTNPLVVDTTTESGKQAIRDMFGLRKNAKVTYNFINKYINKMLYDDAINIRSEEQRQEFFNSTGYDGVILKTDLGTDNEYIVFNSNQIKNVDNTNPTDDADIRKSQQTEGWQSFLDKNFEAKGTKTRLGDIKLPGLTNTIQEEVQKQTSNALLPIANELKELNKNLTKVMNPSEIAQLTPQDANTTPNLPGINRNKVGDGKSKFFDNIKDKTNMLNDEQKTAILNSEDVKYYDKVTNKDSLDKAFERLQENGQSESLRWFNKASENADATDVAEGWILLKQYADSGDTNGMVEVAKKLRDMGTKAGQTVQAFNIMNRLTPEGMVKYAQSELLEAYDQMVKNKSAKWIEENRSKFDLQPNEVKFIMDTMQEVSTMEDGYDKKFKLAQIQKLMTDKLPPSKGAGIKAWMRISMLFNPKTQVRNVAGNALIAPINAFGDMFASGVDKLVSAKTGVRTTGNTNWKNYAQGMKTGLYQSYNDFKNGVNTRNIEGNRFEVTEGKSFNDNNAIGKALNKVDSLLSFMLDAGDRGFYEASFVNSINNQMVLNNTTEVTQDMIDIATQEALSRTWQDNNEYTKFVMNMRSGLNKLLHAGEYGLGDVLIPFAKTPANLTKAIVDYSPVGLVSALNKGIKLNRSLTNGQYNAKAQHEFVQSLGKATAGTMLYVLGYALAQAGITSGASDEDKDVSNFLKNTLGVSSYSIKIGDKTFTYDWAQPIAAPLSMMANMVQKQKEGATLAENITTTLDTGLNLLFEQSFLESLSNVLSQPGEIGTKMIDQFLDLPSRAVPTVFKQITDLIDGTQRQTYVKDKPIQTMVNEVKAKIPGLSYTLDPSVDTLGREIQKYGGKNNLFNVFLNPANVNTGKFSKSGEEIYRLYKETGETNIMPRVAPYYVNKKGEKIILTTQQRTEYQKISGAIIEENIANLLGSTAYQNMTDTNKAEVINDIVNYSYNIAQNQVLGLELADTYKTAYEYAQIGNISDFYEFRNSIDDTDSTTKRISIKNYLVNSDLDDNQIANLYGNYYSSDKTLNAMLGLRIPMKEFIKFDSADIQGQYNTNTGQTISGSKKNATIEYVNTLNLSKAQKAILVKSVYSSYKNNDNDIIRYVNTLPGTANEKKVLLKSIGFDSYDDDVFNYINSQNISRDEKIKKLKELGFTVRDGRVYY